MSLLSDGLPLREGDVVAGKYRLVRRIGRGGMAIVLEAEHVVLGHRVALKFLLPNLAHVEEAVERFLREGRAAVQIQSEHVARVLDVGTLDDGLPYLAMEFLQGSDLAQVVRERGTLPVSEGIDYVLQACEALAEAHALGIVHRDLKPENLFLLRRRGEGALVKVLDFGISKVRSAAAGDLTPTAVILGSPQFMPPEQLRSPRKVDARADIFALGAILYELLSGRPVYEANSVSELYGLVAAAAPPPALSAVRQDVPAEVEAAIYRCLAKDPADRPQNVGELAILLAPFAPKQGALSLERIERVLRARDSVRVPAPPGLAPARAVGAAPASSPIRPPGASPLTDEEEAARATRTKTPPGRLRTLLGTLRRARRTWGVAAVAGGAVAAVGGVILLMALSSGEQPRPAAGDGAASALASAEGTTGRAAPSADDARAAPTEPGASAASSETAPPAGAADPSAATAKPTSGPKAPHTPGSSGKSKLPNFGGRVH